jgi:hypothetical protein
MDDMRFAIVIIPIILGAWTLVSFLLRAAFKAVRLDDDFFAPAGLAALASFLFCGPFCMAIWYALLLRGMALSYRREAKPEQSV